MTVIRTFVAIQPSADALEGIAAIQEELRGAGADVRWVKPEAMHLTLQFLGDVRESEIAGVERSLSSSFAEQEPFDVECRGLGVFPNQRKPRTLWVGLFGEGLGQLAERTEIALAPLGFPPADREFRPHLTLGRLRSMHGFDAVAAALRSSSERSFGSSRIDRTILYRSDLRPTGSIYTVLATFPFAGVKL